MFDGSERRRSHQQVHQRQLVIYDIQTVCECQALLEAELNADRQVLRGFARRGGASESAPANSIMGSGADGDRFDVAWKCPLCGRNTLRTFHVGALREREQKDDGNTAAQ